MCPRSFTPLIAPSTFRTSEQSNTTSPLGRAFYAYCRADDRGIGLETDDYRDLIRVGQAIKEVIVESHRIVHPEADGLSFLYGVILTGDSRQEEVHSRNVCIFADGEVDRSPTGTGVSGRVALRAADGTLSLGEEFAVEIIIGSTFTGWYEKERTYGGFEAVVPVVRGTAHVTGKQRFVMDPFKNGFLLR